MEEVKEGLMAGAWGWGRVQSAAQEAGSVAQEGVNGRCYGETSLYLLHTHCSVKNGLEG